MCMLVDFEGFVFVITTPSSFFFVPPGHLSLLSCNHLLLDDMLPSLSCLLFIPVEFPVSASCLIISLSCSAASH